MLCLLLLIREEAMIGSILLLIFFDAMGLGASTKTELLEWTVRSSYKSNATRLAVQGVAIGSAFIPVVGWAISIGIGTADAIWGDDFYSWIDKH